MKKALLFCSNIGNNRALLMLLLFLSMQLAIGCDDNNAPDYNADINFQDIINLMNMSKDEALNWRGGNYEQVPSDGEKIEKYRDLKGRMHIYFSDLVNPPKIDSIEFESAVDINGIRI